MTYYILRKNGEVIYNGGDFEQIKKLTPEHSGVDNYSILYMSPIGPLFNIEFANQVVKSSMGNTVYLGPCDWKSMQVPLKDLEMLVKEAKEESITAKTKSKKNKAKRESPKAISMEYDRTFPQPPQYKRGQCML
ncbi:hypothetical protein HYX19_02250 [Candidatus Woesearchaeota archaeon]|nr:hypothetical protein [Candidatus Woesearchaeota archaeon]